MSGEIYIADKVTLDLVKAQADAIKAQTVSIQADTDDLQVKAIALKAETALTKADTTSIIAKVDAIKSDTVALLSTPVDVSLSEYFSWAGGSFPYNQGAVGDIVISGPTTWNDSVGYKKIKKLTINAGQTLTIAKSPFYIFADEISFGDTSSTIDASGMSGSASAVYPSNAQALGSTAIMGIARSQGGCGGGMLFVIANKVTGAAGKIKADGGNGYFNGTPNGSGVNYMGAQGALSIDTEVIVSTLVPETFDVMMYGFANRPTAGSYYPTPNFRGNLYLHMGESGQGNGGISSKGGGSGSIGTGGNASIGGSGIGGGGSVYTSPSDYGKVSAVTNTLRDLVFLASIGCTGGGGGSAVASYAGNNGAAGGGGGSVVLWAHSMISPPTLSANGGAKAAISGGNGGAGVTYSTIV